MSYGLGYVEGTTLVMTDHAFCECWRRFSLERPTHSTSILHPTKELRGVDSPTWVQLAPKDGWEPVKIELGRESPSRPAALAELVPLGTNGNKLDTFRQLGDNGGRLSKSARSRLVTSTSRTTHAITMRYLWLLRKPPLRPLLPLS